MSPLSLPDRPPSQASSTSVAIAECLSIVETWIVAQRGSGSHGEIAGRLLQMAKAMREEVTQLGRPPLISLLSSVAEVSRRLASGALDFGPAVADILTLSFERVHLATVALAEDRDLSSLQIEDVTTTLSLLAGAHRDNQPELIARALALLTGDGIWREAEIQRNLLADVVMDTLWAPLKADLSFFRSFGLSHEQRLPYAVGRSDRLVFLAAQMNQEAGTPLDPEQLEAAIYMHDLGMALLPDSVLAKPARLTDDEWTTLHRHVNAGAGLLARMPAWAEAAQMVEQHHERPDGKGYPLGLSEPQIAPGAQLIAILDALEAMTHRRADRESRKSVLRAMSEINASDAQFSRQWVPAANRVMRRLLDASDGMPAPA